MIESMTDLQTLPSLPLALTPNPLDWPGPQFLVLFGVLYVIALIMGLTLRMPYLRTEHPPVDLNRLPISRIAFLRGGQRQMGLASLSGLIHNGHLEIMPSEDGKKYRSHARVYARKVLPKNSDSLARIIFQEAKQPNGLDLSRLPLVLSNHSIRVEESLEDNGLLLQRRCAILPAIPIVILIVFGTTKLVSGVSNGKPVLFLVLALILCVCTLILIAILPRLSAAGTSALKVLEKRNSKLNFGNKADYAFLDASSVAMSVAMFGLVSSSMSQLQTLYEAVVDRSTSYGCESGCGGHGCGGGGGGGCGGGGGGGGGGSGCGGCGGGGN